MEVKPYNYLVYIGVILCLVQLNLGLDLSVYTKPSKVVGKRLKSYNPKTSPGFPHELGYGYYYQGDILFAPNQKGRFAITPTESNMWPNGIVPYVIEGDFDDDQIDTFLEAFEQFSNNTCIRFVPREEEEQYLRIVNDDEGCYSYVGRLSIPYVNKINLQVPGCGGIATVVHELMHTLGVVHEQTRPDRDEYVRFFPQNLDPKYRNAGFISANFDKYTEQEGTAYGVPYNYGSVMHYSRTAFSVSDQRPTLTNRKPWVGDFGSENGLTNGDIQGLLARYCPT